MNKITPSLKFVIFSSRSDACYICTLSTTYAYTTRNRIATEYIQLPCKHIFCTSCMNKQLKTRNRRCALCRDRITFGINIFEKT